MPVAQSLRVVAVTTALAAGLLVPVTSSATAATAQPAAAEPQSAPLAVASEGTVGGLLVENSFVSSVGWVKPGDAYPSRILLTNPGDAPVSGAQVTVTAPTGTRFTGANQGASLSADGTTVTWAAGQVAAKTTKTLVLESKAATTGQLPTIVWRDLSSKAEVTVGGATEQFTSHGPKVIPPGEQYETARYGDRPFPVVPVQYTDRAYQDSHERDLDTVINDPAFEGSTFNLFQEMSLGQLYPDGTVPSAEIETAGFEDADGDGEFDYTGVEPGQTCTGGVTFADTPLPEEGTPLYPERITQGVYNLPGNTAYYGADANGSALVGALGGVGALQQIDGGCGSPGKLVYDAAVIADPEIDYSDFDTDKDGVVDFFMAVFAGCGGNGSSQLSVAGCAYPDAPYDNVWPHSSSLEFYYSDPETGLPGYTTDDQLKDLEGRPLWYTDDTYSETTTEDTGDALKVFVRVGPYNVNPETAIDAASVISHEYGHSLGLPDFYSTGGRETYGDWNLMATDKSQNMDIFSRQELGWVVPRVLEPGSSPTVSGWTDSKQDTDTITWRRPDGTSYTLRQGEDGRVQNSEAYVAKLPGRQLIDPAVFESGDQASATHAWWSKSGNDFGCAPQAGHNFDLAIPGLADLPEGSTIELQFKSLWDIEWDYDYGFVMTTTDGGETYTAHESLEGYTTENTDPLEANPNQNQCQATYDHGLTGTSGSWQAGTEAVDRKAGNYPESVFLTDRYDISDLAGADAGALRFSYATDPGLARPGWFIDDVTVTATTPSGEQVLLETDFEESGSPTDERVFNGGCREDLTTARQCTQGWAYVAAGAEAPADHAYYLEMRDRSGFDLDGNGQIDRTPIGFAAGLSMVYTDEAHGYGNTGTDNPPAQSPLDSQPEPGSDTPDLNDAAWTEAEGDATFTDSGEGHTDNYSDPSTESGNWEFRYDCLSFEVLSMTGAGEGPDTADGDLTGSVAFDMNPGCGRFDYGYGTGPDPDNTAPKARARAIPASVRPGQEVTLSATGSQDAETPDDLDYSWDFGNGGDTKDSTREVARTTYDETGSYTASVTVTDPGGLSHTASVDIEVSDNPADATAPEARIDLDPRRPFTTTDVTLSGARSSDDTTGPDALVYEWNFKNGGRKVDATGMTVEKRFRRAGKRRVLLTVTDAAGNSDTELKRFTVRKFTRCSNGAVAKRGWKVRRDAEATGGRYCTASPKGKRRDVIRFSFTGPRIALVHADARRGGKAVVFVDGQRTGQLSFHRKRRSLDFGRVRSIRGLGRGEHTIKIVMRRQHGFLEGFVTKARRRR